MNRKKILIAHSQGANILKERLESIPSQYEVMTAVDYDAAVNVIEKFKPDLVITHTLFGLGVMDTDNPDRSIGRVNLDAKGPRDLLKFLQSSPSTKDTKIVMYSISSERSLREEFPGIHGYVGNASFEDPGEFFEVLERLLV